METKHSSFSPLASSACLALLLILSGCGGSQFKTRSLSDISKTNSFSSNDSSIEGSYAVLDGKACKAYLGNNVREKGYQPIYISLTNHSDRTLSFLPENLNLPIVPADKVAHAAHLSVASRAIGFGVPGVSMGTFFLTLGVTSAILSYPVIPVILPITLIAAACIAPVAITVHNAKKTNAYIDTVFEEKALDEQFLHAHKTISGLVFVRRRKFNPNFELTLTDGMQKPIILKAHA